MKEPSNAGPAKVALFTGATAGLSEAIATRLAEDSLNTLCVTLVEDTPVYERFAGGELTPIRQKVFDRIASQAPFALARPQDIAAGHVTGATLSATDGATYS